MIYTIPLVSLKAADNGDFITVPVRTERVRADNVWDALAAAMDRIAPDEATRVFATLPAPVAS